MDILLGMYRLYIYSYVIVLFIDIMDLFYICWDICILIVWVTVTENFTMFSVFLRL